MKENETLLVNGRYYLLHIHLAGKRVRGIGRTEIARAYADWVVQGAGSSGEFLVNTILNL